MYPESIQKAAEQDHRISRNAPGLKGTWHSHRKVVRIDILEPNEHTCDGGALRLLDEVRSFGTTYQPGSSDRAGFHPKNSAPEDRVLVDELPASACTICDSTHRLSDGAQIVRRRLAGLSIGNNVERHLLSFVKAVHPGAFDRADVHEDVLATIMRLDEAEAFLAVEPLDGSLRHRTLPSEDVERRPRASTAGWFEIWRKAVSPTRERGEAKSFGRNSIGQCGPLRLGVQVFTP
jgi:hypothetical protein